MNIEKGKISSTQLLFLLIGFIQGADLVLAYTAGVAKHDTWLAALAALVISIPFILIHVALAKRFPGKNLIQINDVIYGSYLGKLISAAYVFFFMILAALNLLAMNNFIVTNILPTTPTPAILLMFAFICAWAVKNGIEVIARCSFMLVIISAASALIIAVLLLKDMKLSNFLPVFDIPIKNFIQGTHTLVSVPFTQTIAFLMIIPYMNRQKEVKSSILMGIIVGGIHFVFIAVRDTAVLGIAETIINSPSFEATRMINIAKILTRLDVLVAIVLINMLFLRVCVFYYSTVLSMAQLFNLRSYLPLILPMGCIIISFAILAYDTPMEQVFVGKSTFPFFTAPFQLIIPLVSLLIAKIRGVPKKQEGGSA